MYCRYCGKQIKDSATECSVCGQQTLETADTSQAWAVTTMLLLSAATFFFPPVGLFFGIKGMLDSSKKNQAGVLLSISSFQSMLMLAMVLGL